MSNKRVLVIDDESLIRHAIADYLTGCGYEAVTAADGVEGLAQARTLRFHAVLVDLRMPQVDGLEVIATLRAEQPALPVVVISGTGVLGDAVEAMRLGAWDYVTKPIRDIDEIEVVVGRVMEKARLVTERDRYQLEIEHLTRSLEAEVSHQIQDLLVQNRELAALNRVSHAISEPLGLDTMLNRAVDAAVAAVEADGGVVWLLNPALEQLFIATALGFSESYLESAPNILLGQEVVGQVAQSGLPHCGSDFVGEVWLSPLGEVDGFCAYMCVPLHAGDDIVGVLGIASRTERDFCAREVNLLTAISNQIGVAVARAQYAADLKRANVQLEQANAELRRLDTLREQFIQNVTHELRTPLGLAHGYIEMLMQGGLSSEERLMALEVASHRVRALVELVESITTLQDLDSQPLRIEKITLAELLQTATQMAGQRASTAGITLRSVCPPDLSPIPGDFIRLAQALYQILDNACKFSPMGSTVIVTTQVVQGAVLISIADQGIGIPSEEHINIFDRFYQVDGSTTRRYSGIGLGLAIAKETIEAHGGRIAVESVVGEGSVFSILLPYENSSTSIQGSNGSHDQ
ncbi:MAG: response regulator [Chloroflexota bacterium]|nr:response regulator [Chloroflexota bacterium]